MSLRARLSQFGSLAVGSLECAQAVGADYLVTGDNDLLTLAGKCIHHAYCRLLRDRESLLRLPGNLVEAGYKTRRVVGP